jgi:hypothetical protein
MGRTRKQRIFARNTGQEKREAILAALARVSSDISPSGGRPEPAGDENDYYTLTSEEVAALLSGNLEKIERWMSNLDQRHATWLLRCIIKQNP